MSETARALARYAMATSRVAPGLYNPASAMDQVLERIQPGLSAKVTTKAGAMIKAGVHSTTALEQALTEEFDLLYPGASGMSGLDGGWGDLLSSLGSAVRSMFSTTRTSTSPPPRDPERRDRYGSGTTIELTPQRRRRPDTSGGTSEACQYGYHWSTSLQRCISDEGIVRRSSDGGIERTASSTGQQPSAQQVRDAMIAAGYEPGSTDGLGNVRYPKVSYPKAAFPKFPKAWFPKQGMSGLGAEAVDTSTRSGGSFGLTRRAASMATAPLPRKQTMMAQATEHVALLDRLMAAVPSNARLVTALRDATDRADAFVNGRGVQNSPWAGEWWVRRLQETISRARTVLSAYGPISRVSGSMSGLGACSCSCEDAGLGTPSTPGRTPTSSGTPASSGTSVSYGTLTPTGTPPRTPASPERLAAIGNMFSGIGSAIESLATGITAAVTGGLEQSRARDQQAFDNRMAEAVAAREAAEAAALREAQSILPVASVGGIGGGTILLGVLGLAVAGGAIYLISKKKD